MSVTTLNLSTGPKLAANEQGVHIIFVSGEGIVGGGQFVTDSTLQQVASIVGLTPKFTDVVVFDRRPWHFAFDKLRGHPQVHHDFPQTRLTLFRKVDHKAVWWSENRFNIFKIVPELPKRAGASDKPFELPVTDLEKGKDGRDIFVARSASPIPDADYQEYKISFTMEGQTIDPNMYCDGGGG